MSDLATVARPYARAVFELARDADALSQWSQRLQALAEAAGVEAMADAFRAPGVSVEALVGILCEAVGSDDEPLRNLLRLLAENRRLEALPAIAAAFDDLRRGHEQSVEVTVTTAAPVDDAQQQTLADAVARHLGRRADIRWAVDETLLAGARIHAGDQVIDASAATQLEQLRHALTA